MDYRGQGPGMFPQQGQGGMAPQGMPKPQGPPQQQQMPQGPPQQMGGGGQGGMTGPGSMQWMGAQAGNRSDLAGRLSQARDALQRAQIMGADPMTMQQLQADLSGLEQAAQRQMLQQQQQFGRQAVRAPGIGGASPYNDSWRAQQNDNSIEMQILAQMFGMGGGGGMGGPGGPVG